MSNKVLLVLLISSCVEEPKEESAPTPTEYTICTYVEGVCVVEEGLSSMDIDIDTLTWTLQTIEYEANFYYPGLNFSALAEYEGFKLIYKWADWHTQYPGTYSDIDTTARVYLRRGDGITPRMECSDRYFVAAHEVLHFIASRYLLETFENKDAHDVEYIFKHWAMINNLPADYPVEGRLYTLTWYMCDKMVSGNE